MEKDNLFTQTWFEPNNILLEKVNKLQQIVRKNAKKLNKFSKCAKKAFKKTLQKHDITDFLNKTA